MASSHFRLDLWETSALMAGATLAEQVDLTGPAAVLDYLDPMQADFVSVPVVEFGVATLIVVAAAAAVVETAAGAAFVSAVEFAVVVGIV